MTEESPTLGPDHALVDGHRRLPAPRTGGATAGSGGFLPRNLAGGTDCTGQEYNDIDIRGQVVVIGDENPGRDRHLLFGVNGINTTPDNLTNGEPGVSEEQVELTITFTTPIILPAGDYFFRPEVLVANGDFLYISVPKPILPPGNAFVGDRQAWIRNSRLSPDWLRIGTDIIGGTAFNMAFSLAGETVPNAGTAGKTNCNGKTLSALSEQFGTLDEATSVLGFSSVTALHDGFNRFCQR